MEKHSHYMEVVQRTLQKLEKGELTNEEIDKGIMVREKNSLHFIVTFLGSVPIIIFLTERSMPHEGA